MNNQIFELASTSSSAVQEIIFEKNIVRIPFNTENERDKKIYDLIKTLQTKVDNLEKEKSQVSFFNLTHNQVKQKVVALLKEKKINGDGKIEVFELSYILRISANQIEAVLDELEKEGVIKTLE